VTPARLQAFVAVAEEGGMSAAARRMYVSQPSLSQTIAALERRVGVELFARTNAGVQITAAGRAFLEEARTILASHDQLFRTMAEYTGEGGGILRLGVPIELPTVVLQRLCLFAAEHPRVRVRPRHLAMTAQLNALRCGDLDLSLMCEHPNGPEFETIQVAREALGVLLATEPAHRLTGLEGIPLPALEGMQWVGFPRDSSPAWYDELSAVLHTHGVDTAGAHDDDQAIAAVSVTSVSLGHAFALTPPVLRIPPTLAWSPLAGHPVVRRTWAVWPANSRRRDVAGLITTLEQRDAA
jgi:DNA-binding transcriptional LysR family regulator